MPRIAVPCENGQVCPHFGHAPQFVFIDIDPQTLKITAEEALTPPPHEPGVLPNWIADQGANVLLTGGIGGRAVQLLAERGVGVVSGVAGGAPRDAVTAYVQGTLAQSGNLCDHGDHGCH